MKNTRIAVAATVASFGLVLAACSADSSDSDSDKSSSDTITVGSGGFPGNEIIAEIYAQALRAKGIKVKKRLDIGAREVYVPAMESGEIDLVPEHTGNLLQFVDKKATATSAADVDRALDSALPAKLETLDVSKAEDKDSLNVTSDFASEKNLTSIADLKGIKGLRLGASPEFRTRSFGIPGLEKLYGISGVTFHAIGDGGGPKTLKALLDGDIDVADIYSTAPSIAQNDLVTLTDPENMFAAQNVVPLIRRSKASGTVKKTLDAISAKLTTKDLLDLNEKNQGADKTSPATLAKQWLKGKGLI